MLFQSVKIVRLEHLIIFFIILFCNCGRDKSVNPVQTNEPKLYAYENKGNDIYIIDYQTFQIEKKITLDLPDYLEVKYMCLSTNRDYLLFSAGKRDLFSLYFVIYDIGKDKVYSYFDTGLPSYRPASFAAAQKPHEPGLIYFYIDDFGLYSFDFLKQDSVKSISSECGFNLGKEIFSIPDWRWLIVKISVQAATHTELDFYDNEIASEKLHFVLNKNDSDSIANHDDIALCPDDKLYVSYRLSKGPNKETFGYFSYYDLETKQLHRPALSFPWSLNPYYMAYSSKRQEAYLVGAYDKFYIIDTRNFSIKKIIPLSGKTQGPSQIVLRPDENVAFVSCYYDNLIICIDLDNGTVLKKIVINHPYKMIIP